MEYERILKILKNTRKSRGGTLKELASAVGVSPQTLSYIENNKVPLKMQEYLSICKALNVTPREILASSALREERWNTIMQMEVLSERDYRIVKDLILLMTLDKEDL